MPHASSTSSGSESDSDTDDELASAATGGQTTPGESESGPTPDDDSPNEDDDTNSETCRDPERRCDGACIDPLADDRFCGAFDACEQGTVCAWNEACTNGRCLPICQDPLEFADPELASFLVTEFGHDGSISPAAASVVTEISLRSSIDRRVESIAGLHCFPNVESLDLGRAPIDDFSPVAAMARLERFDYQENFAPPTADFDLSPLSRLQNLTEMRLEVEGQPDLSPLAELQALRHLELYCGDCGPEDYRPLAALVELETFDFGFFRQPEFSWLAALTHLSRLSVGNCEMKTLDFLRHQPGLAHFHYHCGHGGNPLGDLVDISAIAELEALEQLNIEGAEALENLSPLEGHPSLQRLHFHQSPITSLASIAEVPRLQELQLAHLPEGEAQHLLGLDQLERLRIGGKVDCELHGEAIMQLESELGDGFQYECADRRPTPVGERLPDAPALR